MYQIFNSKLVLTHKFNLKILGKLEFHHIELHPFIIFSKQPFFIYANDHQKIDVKMNLSSFQKFQHAFAFLFFLPSLQLIFLSYIALGFVHPITNHECGINIFEVF